jgi:hypothetical protein
MSNAANKELSQIDNMFDVMASLPCSMELGTFDEMSELRDKVSSMVVSTDSATEAHLREFYNSIEDVLIESEKSDDQEIKDILRRVHDYYMVGNRDMKDINCFVADHNSYLTHAHECIDVFKTFTMHYTDNDILSFFGNSSLTCPKYLTRSAGAVKMFPRDIHIKFSDYVTDCDSYGKYIDLMIKVMYSQCKIRLNILHHSRNFQKITGEKDVIYNIYPDYRKWNAKKIPVKPVDVAEDENKDDNP